jgi:hypothetical protein
LKVEVKKGEKPWPGGPIALLRRFLGGEW